ncbi:hypothetical protein NIK97_06725 [Brucella pseudintermedia]|uniref:Uncharacterized protein n=1 Tax=Brucella pseudintermedia TaxID=370111 RepID=A0ABY5U7C3_9HYPH|nr:hypothetical protein [Brucella pseudintermedia]UWL59244.1 hypothetical protein NIK97_06725 [Brucella pseudintermedia]
MTDLSATAEAAEQSRPRLKYRTQAVPGKVIAAAVAEGVKRKTAAIEKAVAKAVEKKVAAIQRKADKRVREAERRAAEVLSFRGPRAQTKLAVAFLAGQGKSAAEIEKAINGEMSAPAIRTMMNGYGMPLLRSSAAQDFLLVQWKLTDRELLEKHAAKREREAAELAAIIVRKVLAGGDRAIDALVSEFDVIG